MRAVRFDDAEELEARAVLVATGVSYRRLDAPGLEELTGRGVYYGATASEAVQCEGDDVYVVGAANSAGQAALNLARYAKRVVLLVRGGALENTMSLYLVERIRARGEHRGAAAQRGRGGRGDGHLEAITLADRDRGHGGGGADELAVRVHRRLAPHRLARRRRRPRREGVRHHRARPARVGAAGVVALDRVPRSPWRPACPACSPPATCGSTR